MKTIALAAGITTALILAATTALAVSRPAPVPTIRSLCAPAEEVVFDCAQGAKIISLCATADAKGPTHLRYVYGAKGKTELEISDPAAFTSGITPLSGGGIDYVRVTNGDYSYVVYTGQTRGWSQDGWIVEHKGDQISHHVCKRDATGPDVWGPVYAAKLKPAPDAHDFSPPDWTGAAPAKHGH